MLPGIDPLLGNECQSSSEPLQQTHREISFHNLFYLESAPLVLQHSDTICPETYVFNKVLGDGSLYGYWI